MKFLAFGFYLLLTACYTVNPYGRPVVTGELLAPQITYHESLGDYFVGQKLFSNADLIIESIREEPSRGIRPNYIITIGGVEVSSLEALETLFEVAKQFKDPLNETRQLLLSISEALRTDYDPVTNSRVISVERYSSRSPLALSIVRDQGGTHIKLRFFLMANRWVFFEEVLVGVGGQTYHFRGGSNERRIGNRLVEETLTIPVGQVELSFIKNLILAGSAHMRFIGNDDKRETFIDEGHVEDIRNSLKLYEILLNKGSTGTNGY